MSLVVTLVCQCQVTLLVQQFQPVRLRQLTAICYLLMSGFSLWSLHLIDHFQASTQRLVTKTLQSFRDIIWPTWLIHQWNSQCPLSDSDWLMLPGLQKTFRETETAIFHRINVHRWSIVSAQYFHSEQYNNGITQKWLWGKIGSVFSQKERLVKGAEQTQRFQPQTLTWEVSVF